MKDLDLQRGCERVSRMKVVAIPIPSATESYSPMSHLKLVDKILAVSKDILTGFTFKEERLYVSRQGQQFFALLKFKGKNPELDLAIALRNSYDRSMSIGLAVGANISFCNSLALHDEIAVMKKHTKGVLDAIEDVALVAVYRGRSSYEKVITDSEHFKEIPVSKNKAFQLMGLLYGHDIVSPRQLAVLKEEWLHPSNFGFQEKNMWTFFSATMQCLKTTPPLAIMEKHIEAYEMLAEAMRTNKEIGKETAGLKWFDIDPAYQFQLNAEKDCAQGK